MFDPIDFDLALVSPWPVGRVVAARLPDREITDAVDRLMLETKAAAEPNPVEALQHLLNDMGSEMRLQFEAFRNIRETAQAKLAGGDEAELKLAKADIKAATDALSLIVRTLEKIDSLQRNLVRDLEATAEKDFDETAYDALLADIDRKIECRAEERARILLGERLGAAAIVATGPPGRQRPEGTEQAQSAPT